MSLASRLVEVVTGLGALDTPALLTRLSHGAAELLGASAAGYGAVDGRHVEMVSVAGLPEELVLGQRFALEGSAIGRLDALGARSLQAPALEFPALNAVVFGDEPGTIAVARTEAAGRTTGGLYVALPAGTRLDTDALDVLELLAAHAGVALHDAARFAAAERARRQVEAVIDATVDGLAVLDPDGRVTAWNRALAQLTGISAQEAVGAPFAFEVPEDGGVLELHWRERWLEIHTSALHRPGPGEGDRVVDVRDVSAAKELESAKDLFLATAGHELRTPLTVLRGVGDTLLHRWDALLDADRRAMVATMVERAVGMSRLVEQLMLGSRAGTAAIQVQVRAFDLSAEVRRVVRGVDGASPEHPVTLDAAAEVRALGDPACVEPVLGQLLENAVKYSPGGGPVEVSVVAEGRTAVLRVADRGVGIDPQDLDRVFDRFVRRSRAADAGGVGLGLWIARRYVEAQGGTVLAHARDGGGTVLEVRLPR